MKKTYIAPALETVNVQTQQMMALSKFEGNADPAGEVLVKDGGDWDIWGSDVAEETEE
ncbi:MAG: hypothetical protein K6C30_00290 [Bacteroidaceae bacterium]|nr:hypothetical protein [Bacteroidaceae bacterium]